jgi:plasmid stability protein
LGHGAIQVKNVPEDLHEALRRRATHEGMDLQSYLLRVIRRELSLPSETEWLEGLRANRPRSDCRQLRRCSRPAVRTASVIWTAVAIVIDASALAEVVARSERAGQVDVLFGGQPLICP